MFILITFKRRDFNLNNQARTKIMESTLFTTLTVTEEASLSGGWKEYKPKKKDEDKKPEVKPTIITQLSFNIAAGILSGAKIDQTAFNVAEDIPGGATVTQTAFNIASGTGK
jgi:hypothetical protein